MPVEQRHDKRPILSDLRESGSIEQDADLVMFVYRDEYYNPEDTDSAGIAEVILSKHRNGATGIEKLAFQKRYAKLSWTWRPPDDDRLDLPICDFVFLPLRAVPRVGAPLRSPLRRRAHAGERARSICRSGRRVVAPLLRGA